MNIMVASDIHGSEYYCEKLIKRYKAEKPDILLLLGDILYHGPRNNLPRGYNPKKVAQLLNDFKKNIICIHGNCDSEVDKMLLDFHIIPESTVICINNVIIFATHGHIFNLNNLPSLNIDILLHGHTHIPEYKQHNNCLYINPGSVSLPKNNCENSYLVFNGEQFIWKTLNGITYMNYPISLQKQ